VISGAPPCLASLSERTGVSGGDGKRNDCTITRSDGRLSLFKSSVSSMEPQDTGVFCPKIKQSSLSSISSPKVPRLIIGASALKNVVSSVGDTAEESEGHSSGTSRTSIVICGCVFSWTDS
jgi:hypothetical protein